MQRILKVLLAYRDPRHWIKNILWRVSASVSDLDAVFVVGAPRSGTTLLQRVLSVHSQAFSIEGETGLFSYQNIFDPRRKHFGLSAHEVSKLLDRSSDIVDFLQKGVEQLRGKTNKKIFIEKTPQHILHLPFIVKHFPNSKIVHIVRDGRDCYCSSRVLAGVPQNRSVSSFARYWKKCASAPFRCTIPDDRLLTIKYEDFVHTPSTILSRVMNFLNLKVEASQLDSAVFGKDRRAYLTEFKQLSRRINPSSVGRWKRELLHSEIKRFEKIALNQLMLFGYEVSTSRSTSLRQR